MEAFAKKQVMQRCFQALQRKICLAEVLAETSQPEDDLFSGGVFKDRSCQRTICLGEVLQKQVSQRRICLAGNVQG